MPNAKCKMPKASRAVAAFALLLISAAPLFAQDAAQAKPQPQQVAPNPIVVERITDQFFVAPEYKLTDMSGHTGQLVGATGGMLMQETFLLGGSVYHLVQGPSGWELTYGGFVFGAQMPPEKKIRFGARSLIGFGTASNLSTVTYPGYQNFPMPYGGMNDRHYPGYGYPPGYPTSARVHYEENFFVFEPQGDLLFAITNKIRFGVSAGYRWTDSSDYFQHAINGVTGTFMVQVGF